ncbi:MAG: DUF2243 domain-containing protein [Rivularia sp. T60_A2020_040]|nr:DUF2243 domain-containing protein [Rivularia sp. T60_A2020_040]
MESQLASSQRKPLILAGICLGIGLGGFFDGIVLHQILQWHHMLSNVKPGLNEFAWDMGFLALGALIAVIGWLMLQQTGKSTMKN